jgi:hypothetical protein
MKEDGVVKIDPEMTVKSSKFFQSIKTELLGKYIYDRDDYDFIEDNGIYNKCEQRKSR